MRCVVANPAWPQSDRAMNAANDSQTDCPSLCPLNLIRVGMSVRIKRLHAPEEMSQRLREIGFCEDQIIRLVTSQANYICQVCNSRLAISADIAQMIMVEPVLQRAG